MEPKVEPVEPAETYLQRMRLRYSSPMRPTKEQAGHADLPLFQTDLEEFTGTTGRE